MLGSAVPTARYCPGTVRKPSSFSTISGLSPPFARPANNEPLSSPGPGGNPEMSMRRSRPRGRRRRLRLLSKTNRMRRRVTVNAIAAITIAAIEPGRSPFRDPSAACKVGVDCDVDVREEVGWSDVVEGEDVVARNIEEDERIDVLVCELRGNVVDNAVEGVADDLGEVVNVVDAVVKAVLGMLDVATGDVKPP